MTRPITPFGFPHWTPLAAYWPDGYLLGYFYESNIGPTIAVIYKLHRERPARRAIAY